MKKSTKSLETPTIIRKKVWVDTQIVNTSCKHLSNKVSYCVFKGDVDPSVIPKNFGAKHGKKTTNSVCFSGLLSKITSVKANRMYTKLEVDRPNVKNPASEFILSPEERSSWLALAKEHKLLPPYINEEAIEDISGKDKCANELDQHTTPTTIASGEFLIDIEKLSPAMLYVYLSTIRNIREDPGFPRSVMYLVNKLGMNFFAAYLFSSAVVMDTTGHHVLEIYRPYGLGGSTYDDNVKSYVATPADQESVEKVTCPNINQVIGLQRLVNSDPRKYDTRDIIGSNGGFRCSSTLKNISKIGRKTFLQELFEEDIVAAIMSTDDNEAKECIQRFDNKSPYIIYESEGGTK